MKKLLLLTLVILNSINILGQTVFQKLINTTVNYPGITRTNDGGFFMFRKGYAANFNDSHILIAKYDSLANVLWTKSIRDTLGSVVSDVIQTPDHGFMLYGLSNGYYNNSNDFTYDSSVLIKLDSSANIQWAKSYRYSINLGGGNVKQTPDGGYIFVANTEASNPLFSKIFVIKTSADGSVVWNKVFQGGTNIGVSNLFLTADGGYLLSGGIEFVDLNGNILLVKLNAQGNIQWSKRYGSSDLYWNGGTDIQLTSDGGLIITKSVLFHGNPYGDCVLIKINNQGNIEWSKAYLKSGGEKPSTVLQTSDGGFIIMGSNGLHYQSTYKNIYVIRTDSQGNSVWVREYGGTEPNEGNAILHDTNEGFIFTGTKYNSANTYLGQLFIKADKNGYTACNQGILSVKDSSINVVVNSYSLSTSSNVTVSNFNYITEILTIPTTTTICQKNSLPLEVTISQTNISCFGYNDGIAVVTPTNGIEPYSFLWNTIPPQTTDTATGLSPGQYCCKITDSTGTFLTVNIIITQPDSFVAQFAPDFQSGNCNADSIKLVANSGIGITYQWLLNNDTIPNADSSIYYATLSGNYTLVETTSDGCITTSAPIHLSVNGDLSVVITVNGNTISCPPFQHYQWYENDNIIESATDSTYTISNNGIYYVVITDTNGCIDTSNTLELTYLDIEKIGIVNFKLNQNPINSKLLLEFETIKSEIFHIAIYNQIGQTVYFQKFDSKIGNFIAEINISNFEAGYYFLSISGKDWVKNERIVKTE